MRLMIGDYVAYWDFGYWGSLLIYKGTIEAVEDTAVRISGKWIPRADVINGCPIDARQQYRAVA